ncbi:hypothetical protein H6F94_30180 [Leptolyngbya sp. FACHB-261]|nr:hypothetical protein [Leptolyngbya sp. FACHB-261]
MLDYNLEFKGANQSPDLYTPTPYRSSDHDPVVVGLGLSSTLTVLNGGNGSDSLNGTSGRDAISGGNGSDTLRGGNGSDSLDGGNGNDVLLGEVGNDQLLGGNGDDLLEGGLGTDALTGGRGSDQFVLAPNSGTDTILDFADGQDRLILSGGLAFAQLAIVQGSGSNQQDTLLVLQGTSEVLAILKTTQASIITSADFSLS